MSIVRFLDFQYSLSKTRCTVKPTRLFSNKSRQDSGVLSTFQPKIDEMKRVFDKFDTNKDGKISKEEYKAILRAMGEPKVEKEVAKIFQVADTNRDGYIDFKEFIELHNNGGGARTMEIRRAFRAFDMDEDGKISAEELLEMLKRLGEPCSLEDCRRMVRAVDKDRDGAIDVDEFMDMMT